MTYILACKMKDHVTQILEQYIFILEKCDTDMGQLDALNMSRQSRSFRRVLRKCEH